MAVTTPTSWSVVTRDEITPGRPVAIGRKDELRATAREQNRNFYWNLRTHAAVLSAPRASSFDPGIQGIGATWTAIGRGKLRVWSDSARFSLTCYGAHVYVRVTIGGVTINATNTSTLAWFSGGPTTITGASVDADGYATVLVEAQYSSNPPQLEHVGIIERGNTLPDGTATWTDFAGMDDYSFQEDIPADAWLLQQFDDNSRWLDHIRSRGMLHLYPISDHQHWLSSLYWRLDGPYTIVSQPWSEQAEVYVTVDLIAGDGQIFALSEHEKFEDVVDERATALSSGVNYAKFVVKIKPGIDQDTQVWVAFKSDLDATLITSLDVGRVEDAQSKIYSEQLGVGMSPMPWRYVASSPADESYVNATGKGLLAYTLPSSYWDVSSYLGDGSTTAELESQHLVSPHIRCGVLDHSQLTRLADSAGGTAYAPQMELRRCGLIELQSVSLEIGTADVARQKIARPGDTPSSGAVFRVQNNVNAHSVYGTPMLITRHPGNRNLFGQETGGSNIVRNEGGWLFVFAVSAVTLPIEFPIFDDPNQGVSSGLAADTIYGRVEYYAVTSTTQNLETVADLECYFYDGSLEYRDPDGGSVEEALLGSVTGPGDAPFITLGDAQSAAWATHDVPGASPTETWQHAYCQQVTWPTDGYKQRAFWQRSQIFSMPMPSSFPLLCEIRLRFDPRSGAATLVIPSVHVWCGPRQEP